MSIKTKTDEEKARDEDFAIVMDIFESVYNKDTREQMEKDLDIAPAAEEIKTEYEQ